MAEAGRAAAAGGVDDVDLVGGAQVGDGEGALGDATRLQLEAATDPG